MNNMEDFMLFTTVNQPKGAVKKRIHCFIHVWVCGCVCVCLCVGSVNSAFRWTRYVYVEARDQGWIIPQCLSFLTKLSFLIGLELSNTLIEYLASNPERSSWRTSLSAGIRKCAVLPSPTFRWVLWTQLRSSCLPGKHFSDWVISSVPSYCLDFIHLADMKIKIPKRLTYLCTLKDK